MIVYNVGRRFFPMKNDADAYRREQSLPPGALHKLVINNREELAEFLDGLCEDKSDSIVGETPGNADTKPEDRIHLSDPSLDFVPSFIKADWERRRSNRRTT